MDSSEGKLTYGVVANEAKRAMNGLEFLTGVANGTLTPPPIQRTLDFRLVEVKKGFVVFVGLPRFEFYNPLGSIHGGYTAALLDSCMSCAVHSTLDTGYSYATLEVKINYLRAIVTETGEVRAEGRIINVGKRIGTAEGRLLDASGKIYAHCTTTCLIFPL